MAQRAAQGDPPQRGHLSRQATGQERTLPYAHQLRETPKLNSRSQPGAFAA